MTDARRTLAHFLELADEGPALRAALAEEIADLLLAWPQDYPHEARIACEALLEKSAHDLDAATLARLHARLRQDARLAALLPAAEPTRLLVEAARRGEDIAPRLARVLGTELPAAREILADASGRALANACRAAHIDRAAFSALALLCGPGTGRGAARVLLGAYDGVLMSEAARHLRGERGTARAA